MFLVKLFIPFITLCEVFFMAEGGTASIQIVGGFPTTINKYKFTVQIHFRNELQEEDRCGGSAIADRWVLTAAHCIKHSENSTRYLVWDKTEWGPWQNNPDVPINCLKDCYIHPSYVEKTYDRDVGLIYVRGKRTISHHNLIQLSHAPPTEGTPIFIAGWGTGPEEKVKHILHEVSVPVVDRVTCNETWTGIITENMICAAPKEGGKDACNGDSGGPAAVRDDRGHLSLAGIVSFGFQCALPGFYGVYTNVASVRSWVEETIARSSRRNIYE